MLEKDYPKALFDSYARIMGGEKAEDALGIFNAILDEFSLEKPKFDGARLDEFVDEVNVSKLKTNPVRLDRDDIKEIYKRLNNEL